MGKTAGRFFSKSSGSDSSSDSDDEVPKNKGKPGKPGKPVSSMRLNELLASMKVEDKSLDVTPSALKKRKEERKVGVQKLQDVQSVEQATKTVAESLGGDVKQTESELLRKLLDISTQASEARIRTEDTSKLK